MLRLAKNPKTNVVIDHKAYKYNLNHLYKAYGVDLEP